MSDTCGNCDCANKSQCTKKGDSYGAVVVDTESSRVETVAEEVTVAEHDGCSCGTNCACGTSCCCGK